VRWAEWVKIKPTDGVSIFEMQPELKEQESCIRKSEEYEIVDLEEEDHNLSKLAAVDEEEEKEEEAQKPQAQQGAVETRAMKERKKEKGGRIAKNMYEKIKETVKTNGCRRNLQEVDNKTIKPSSHHHRKWD